MRIASALLLMLFGALCVVMPARAAESYANCTGTISSLPTTISTPGTWCLKQNLSTAATSGNAITINANDVVLDCNDFQIKGTPSATSASIGIKSDNHLHDSVRHCKVQGFGHGVAFNGVGVGIGGHVVEDNEFAGNTVMGILVQGDGSIVRRNRVFNTGPSNQAIATGIHTGGMVNVSDNTVSNVSVAAGGNVYGYSVLNNHGGSIAHNSLRMASGFGYGMYMGNYANISYPLTITDNNMLNDPTSDSVVGLLCPSITAANHEPIASRNIVVDFGRPDYKNECAYDGQNDIYR